MDLSTRVETYEKKSAELFERWKKKEPFEGLDCKIDHGNNVFVRDGIVDPEQWFSQDVRPLFLLKEAYNGDEDWDLREHIMRDEPMKGHTAWRKITQWAYGIMGTSVDHIPFFDDMIEATVSDKGKLSFGNDHLKKIAVVNIKKSNGQPTSNNEEVGIYAWRDKEELAEQIELIDPTVIICGNTSDSLDTIMGAMRFESYPNCRREGYDLFYDLELNNHRVIVIDYWHPSNHFPNIMNYYGLVGTYQHALKHYSKMGEVFDF